MAMGIVERDTAHWIEVSLSDDGTLDTVIDAWCERCEDGWTERYSEAERDDDGYVTSEWLEQVRDELEAEHEC